MNSSMTQNNPVGNAVDRITKKRLKDKTLLNRLIELMNLIKKGQTST
jgi:hypothetical protein